MTAAALVDVSGILLADLMTARGDALDEAIQRVTEQAEDPDDPECKFNSAI